MNKSAQYNPKIMGIINVTPDSFSDGGNFFETDAAVAHGIALYKEGADILDVGGESTRPSAAAISIEEELHRVIPVIKRLRDEVDIPISIDTRNADVMKAAVSAGATMVNDISALSNDKNALTTVATLSVPVCLMHMKGEPSNMQINPTYDDVVEEVFQYLLEKVEMCLAEGIKKESIYCDVGIGFGKTLEHNVTLLQNISYFRNLGTRLMIGTSRKSFIDHISKSTSPQDRLGGSLASLVSSLKAKIDIFRVHDVAATRQFIDVYTAIDTDSKE